MDGLAAGMDEEERMGALNFLIRQHRSLQPAVAVSPTGNVDARHVSP